MPTADRRPRRRVHGTRTAAFSSEREAREAAAEVRALPEGPGRDAASRELRPRLERWVMSSWRMPKLNDHDWLDRVAKLYVFRPNLLPTLPSTRAIEF